MRTTRWKHGREREKREREREVEGVWWLKGDDGGV